MRNDNFVDGGQVDVIPTNDPDTDDPESGTSCYIDKFLEFKVFQKSVQ